MWECLTCLSRFSKVLSSSLCLEIWKFIWLVNKFGSDCADGYLELSVWMWWIPWLLILEKFRLENVSQVIVASLFHLLVFVINHENSTLCISFAEKELWLMQICVQLLPCFVQFLLPSVGAGNGTLFQRWFQHYCKVKCVNGLYQNC